jgi:propanol-preferring alcohol dehydrogenase
MAGEIVELGPGVDDFQEGERVTVFIYLICGACRFCLAGRETLCEDFRGFVGVHVHGGLAEHAVVPAMNLVRIPSAVGYEEACIIPGAVAAAYHAIERRLKVRPSDTVLVVGAAGGVGVHAVQLARLAGARVIAADVSDERLERVAGLGAEATINVARQELSEAVRRLARRGATKVLELVGTTASLQQSVRSLARAGALAIMGFQPGSELRADPVAFVNEEIIVTGSRSVSRQELAETLELVERGALQAVVTERLPLEEAQSVLERLSANEIYGRVAILPS